MLTQTRSNEHNGDGAMQYSVFELHLAELILINEVRRLRQD